MGELFEAMRISLFAAFALLGQKLLYLFSKLLPFSLVFRRHPLQLQVEDIFVL
jgi:hypothetical protein